MLTNYGIILLKKGAFGASKGAFVFPISRIKIHRRRPQVELGKSEDGSPLLEVHLVDRVERFAFRSGGKRKVKAWIAKIIESATMLQAAAAARPVAASRPAVPQQPPSAGMGPKSAPRVPPRQPQAPVQVDRRVTAVRPDPPVAVAGSCSGCGAPVAGFRGRPITCEYCGSAAQL